MSRLLAAAKWAIAEFGPLIVFLSLNTAFGIRPAIAGSVAFILADAAWRSWRGLTFSRIYLLSGSLTVIFGAIDLMAATPFMLKYEAVITNLATAAAFAAGARGRRPLLLDIAEKRQPVPFADRADVIRFFQIFTLLWAVYFVAKAGLYLWIGAIMPLGEAVAMRSLAGGASLALMVVLSITQGRRLFALCQRLGLLPAVPAD